MPEDVKRVTIAAALKPEERRKHARYPFTAAAEVVEPKTEARVTGRSSDLAIGGCFIDAMSPFPPGTSVVVRLAFEQRKFEAKARVAYSQSGMGMGLAFTAVEPDQKWILEQWLGELSGQPAAKLKAVESEQAAALASAKAAGGNDEPRYVLNELIVTLIRKGVLTDKEGKALLLKLMS
ncbi:MAG: PilZ domain-containing protein [Candidatus Acidiferrales bacterium]